MGESVHPPSYSLIIISDYQVILWLSFPVISIPNYPTGTGGVVDLGTEYLWKEDVKEAKRKITLLDKNKKHAYALVIGQCLPKLVSKIRGSDLYAQADVDQDAVQLLLIIQG
jgi:hypothetical protein